MNPQKHPDRFDTTGAVGFDWGSHLPPLMACLAATTGPVVELGMGHWSTPILAAYCKAAGRYLTSVEASLKWFEQFKDMATESHSLYFVPYGESPRASKYAPSPRCPSVVLLDHAPESQRIKDALLFQDAEFLVIHDWESGGVANPFTEHLQLWKHRKVYERYIPSTMVLSKTREIPF